MGMAIFEILGHEKLFEGWWPDEDTIILEAISTLSPSPPTMWQAWPKRSKFFKDDGSWQEDKKPQESEISRPLANRIRDCMEHEAHSKRYGYLDEELRSLEDMLRSMLQYEPSDRITVDQARRSEWAREYGIPALLKAVLDVDLRSLGINETGGNAKIITAWVETHQ